MPVNLGLIYVPMLDTYVEKLSGPKSSFDPPPSSLSFCARPINRSPTVDFQTKRNAMLCHEPQIMWKLFQDRLDLEKQTAC